MMVFLLLLLQTALCIVSTADQPDQTVCTGSACYTLHLRKSTFTEAQHNCTHNGGNLVTVKSHEEASEVNSVLSRIREGQTSHDLKFWIGLTLRKGECTSADSTLKGFTWVSGSSDTPYSNWEVEPPGTCTEERCVAIHYVLSPPNSDSFGWMDSSCKDAAGYMCKFNFKGMCKTIPVAGAGEVHYTLTFATFRLSDSNAFLPMVPHGTIATVKCANTDNEISAYCLPNEGFFGWSPPGPLCDSVKQGCRFANGGCDHRCVVGGNGDARCECEDGYALVADQVTCVQIDYCQHAGCEYRCKSDRGRFHCLCPDGFQLAPNGLGCIDVDECASRPCEQLCANGQGSFTCSCRDGYVMVNGTCHDIDECMASRCDQGCLNAPGSFSCYCLGGFEISEDGRSCLDIDECLNNPCEQRCANTVGSFECSCKQHYKVASDGIACIPNPVRTSATAKPIDERDHTTRHTDGIYRVPSETMVTLAARTPTEYMKGDSEEKTTGFINEALLSYTSAPVQKSSHSTAPTEKTGENGNNVRQIHNASQTWILASVMSALVALLLLIAVVSAVVICRRNCIQRETKKESTATDNYCWVGNETHTSKEGGGRDAAAQEALCNLGDESDV